MWCLIYAVLSVLYRFGLNKSNECVCLTFRLTIEFRSFEKAAVFCDNYSKLIPLQFIVGFYVQFVIGRWWNWYCAIPRPDPVAQHLAVYLEVQLRCFQCNLYIL